MILINSMNYWYLLLKINIKPTLFPCSINLIMYTEKNGGEMLSKMSVGYLKKAIQYLYESKNNNEIDLSK